MPKIELIQGDCLEKMKDIPDGSVDLVLCDLPYGATICKWPFKLLWGQYNRICKKSSPIVLFGQEPFSSALRLSNVDRWKYDWYWQKEQLTNTSQVKKRAGETIEVISIFYHKQCTYNPQTPKHEGNLRSNKVRNGKMGILTDSSEKKVFEHNDTGFRYPTQLLTFQRDCLKSNLHPAQKPVLLLEYLVKTYTNEGDTVLDNCMGSGTTGVACKNLNRNFIGIELDQEYFKVAEKRINENL